MSLEAGGGISCWPNPVATFLVFLGSKISEMMQLLALYGYRTVTLGCNVGLMLF